ncbi:hypothetical protein NQZ68_031474 [Dissostichus eleginoides]|nr:hypothetical protein NQZ68_031474 [Dissostichus eleginoides]
MYRVVKAPKGGSVYTIAPANDLIKTKQVRTLLKAVVGTHSPGGAPVPLSILPDSRHSEDELSFDGDLWVSRNETASSFHQIGGGDPRNPLVAASTILPTPRRGRSFGDSRCHARVATLSLGYSTCHFP